MALFYVSFLHIGCIALASERKDHNLGSALKISSPPRGRRDSTSGAIRLSANLPFARSMVVTRCGAAFRQQNFLIDRMEQPKVIPVGTHTRRFGSVGRP
jgi:hypothetical protein